VPTLTRHYKSEAEWRKEELNRNEKNEQYRTNSDAAVEAAERDRLRAEYESTEEFRANKEKEDKEDNIRRAEQRRIWDEAERERVKKIEREKKEKEEYFSSFNPNALAEKRLKRAEEAANAWTYPSNWDNQKMIFNDDYSAKNNYGIENDEDDDDDDDNF
jgi:hypothetical protein